MEKNNKIDLKLNLRLKNILGILIAGIVNAIGVTMFIAPVKLYDSGISGTSILLSQITPLTLSMFLLILNVPIFLYGLKRQGLTFTAYAIIAVAVYSLVAFLIEDVLPINVNGVSPLAETDLFLCALFGGVISGVGSGLAIRFGGAMDGIEVLAVIFSKKLNLTFGTFVMIYNVILYVIAGIIMTSWILPLYSIVTYLAGSKTVDFVVEGLDRSKAATIVTGESDKVCKALSEEFGSGITVMPAKGYFSGTDKNVVYLVLNRFQISKMREIVSKNDPLAYISIADVADVFSANGAKNLKK